MSRSDVRALARLTPTGSLEMDDLCGAATEKHEFIRGHMVFSSLQISPIVFRMDTLAQPVYHVYPLALRRSREEQF